jgi:hypothetical protein
MAMKTAPTACAELPPATGTLNIMITNENAAQRARVGIRFALKVFFTFLSATAQTGNMQARTGRVVCGARYPSGICIKNLYSKITPMTGSLQTPFMGLIT